MGSNVENVIAPPIGTDFRATNGFVPGTSPAMARLESLLSEVAATDIPVLLMGECGTGKQTLARRIHQLSARSTEAMLQISCGAVRSETFSDELGIGCEGAAGTVFLDEISELEPACQRSLLSVLPDGEARPRRGLLTARLISTTSLNLDDEVNAGHFRRELYYRINGVSLRLPALRERKEDIPSLATYFHTKHSYQLGRAKSQLSDKAMEAFVDYSWPGNIRELENVIKKIVALNDEVVALSDLAPIQNGRSRTAGSNTADMQTQSLKVASRAASREAERGLILKALARTRWNRKRAAQELQISYKSLLYKLKQIGLEENESN